MSDVPPEEIIGEILIRLPVKSLLRFRCVSKPWRSMIDSRHFTKLHLHHSYKTSSNRTLVVDSGELLCIDLDALERLDIGDNKFKPNYFVCSCDGLVLLVFELGNIVLWNPATRKFNKLPETPLQYQVSDNATSVDFAYALGYDSKNDDYKVVRLIQVRTRLDGRRVSSEAKVFSLKSNTWKRIDDFPFMLSWCDRWGAYLNDTLHTVVKEGGRHYEVIMGFNIAKEEHFEVPKPCTNSGLAFVVVMGGCLTAIGPGKRNRSEIWVMKEYGVKESWTKLFCFQPPLGDDCLSLIPLAYSKSGDEVLFNNGMCLNWYDLRKKTVSIARVPGLTASFSASAHFLMVRAEFCVGSLVSPHSPAGTEYELKRKKGKEVKKKRDDFLSVGFKLVL